MIWDLDLMAKVRALRTEMIVDLTYAVTYGDRLAFAAPMVRKKLVGHIGMLGADAHPNDVTTSTQEDPAALGTRVIARWDPPTHMIQMRGGIMDGRYGTWEHLDQPIRIPVESPMPTETEPIYAMSSSRADRLPRYFPVVPQVILTYELSGWDEDTRRWVFSLAG